MQSVNLSAMGCVRIGLDRQVWSRWPEKGRVRGGADELGGKIWFLSRTFSK